MIQRRRMFLALLGLFGLAALGAATGLLRSETAASAARRAASRFQAPPAAAALAPDSIKPGLRLTYYLMTGSLSGSVNGWVPDEEGDWADRQGRRYATERKGLGSHGLIQATVVGGDGGVFALAEPFYLFNGGDTTPIYNTSLDSLVTSDTGGDFWMHPRRQAQVLRDYPWNGLPLAGRTLARTTAWRDEAGRTYQATHIVIIGGASRTSYIYDQAGGYLLYLSRLTSEPPAIRDRTQPLSDSVSYATFLRFRGARQLNLPWLGKPMAESLRAARTLAYRGQSVLQGQGIVPTPLAITASLQLQRSGADWLWLHGRTQTQGTFGITEFNSVDGPGSLAPLAIPPAVLAGLAVGQVIDRDPLTGFAVRVANADAQYVALQSDGPRQSFTYVYERARGLLLRKITQDRSLATGMITVTDIQLTGVQ
ncbi:MAG: hypothetical protein NTZ26_03130 [Candidatus Aminicenantes bacterium]|nr:hypothetical protein [Candidatus Aminicenantes bacterium]